MAENLHPLLFLFLFCFVISKNVNMSGEKRQWQRINVRFARYLRRDLHGPNILAHKVDAGRKKKKRKKRRKTMNISTTF